MVINNFRRLSAAMGATVLLAIAGCQQPQQQPDADELQTPEQTEAMIAEEQRMQAVSLYVDAMMLNDINEREEAIQKLNQAVELDPQFALAFSLKGDILQTMEQYEDSADAYERATELDPWSFRDRKSVV